MASKRDSWFGCVGLGFVTWPNHVPESDETMGAVVRSNSTGFAGVISLKILA